MNDVTPAINEGIKEYIKRNQGPEKVNNIFFKSLYRENSCSHNLRGDCQGYSCTRTPDDFFQILAQYSSSGTQSCNYTGTMK